MATTIETLAEAIGALQSALGGHPVSKSVAFREALFDVSEHELHPEDPRTIRALEDSAENLLDELAITRFPDTPEHVAAKRAFDAVLSERVAAIRALSTA